ncbi:MAG TPA: FecR domain-containing protein [Steroidobacteraceae bacterium]|nr:FecR domain-containing protein [Steroidobacteraceae bacterium]
MSRATDIADTAAQWLVRLEAQTSPEVWDAFQAWLDQDPRHQAAFVRLRVAWNRIDVLKNLRPADGNIDADLLSRAQVRPATLRAQGLHPLKGKPRRRSETAPMPERRRILLAAAAVTAVAVAGWLGTREFGWKSYATSVGAHTDVVLQDGSTVRLNTDTRLRTRISTHRREIVLERGEALFNVSHDARRPFYVTAASTVVRAVGTEFSVRIRDAAHVDVLVAEGRVALGSRASTGSLDEATPLAAAPQLSAGKAASVEPGTVVVMDVPSADIPRRLAWTAGRLAFQGETLSFAVQEFNRYNRRQLAVTDPALGQIQVGGVFRATDPDSFVDALRHSFGIRAQTLRSTGEIRLVAEDRIPPP